MRYRLFTFLIFSAFAARSQDMELKKLGYMIDQPAITITDSLAQKGWMIRPELSGAKGRQLYTTFSFGHQQSDQSKALAWLRIHADNGMINQLYYQSSGIEQFNHLVKELQESGAEKKDKQSIEDNQVSTYYVGKNYTYQTIIGTDSYTMMVMTNKL